MYALSEPIPLPGHNFRIRVLLLILILLALATLSFVTPAAGAQVVTEFRAPTPNAGLARIAAGPDGALWFTEFRAGKIGRITPDGAVTEFPIPSRSALPAAITSGPDGNVWFTDGWGAVWRVTTDGVMTHFSIPTGYSLPRGIAAGPDGNLWFTEFWPDKIGRVTPSGTLTEFPLPTGSGPTFIAAGPDGNLWFTEQSSNRIGRITTAGVVTGEFSVPTPDSGLVDIALGPDGNLWFTENWADRIGRITVTGEVTEFPISAEDASGPDGIATGPDGNLWFTAGDVIGRMTTRGDVSTFPLLTAHARAMGIAAGPDGNLWFTETGANQIGRITAPSPGECAGDPTLACLNAGRFEVQVAWSAPSQGTSGIARAVVVTPDTGCFWFFDSSNVELVVKVLDGNALNGHFWVFYGALSDVQYTIAIRDTVTGAVKTYQNPAGTLASVADTSAFGATADGVASEPAASAAEIAGRTAEQLHGLYATLTRAAAAPKLAPACTPGGTSLCLNQSRFQLTVDWAVPDQGRSGQGTAVPLTADTGYFWFFNDANVELVVKVLDGTSINGHYWVFYGALSDVQYTITVTDTQTQAVRTYTNAYGTLASAADTEAF